MVSNGFFLASLVNVSTDSEIANCGMSMQTADELFTFECRSFSGICAAVTALLA